jgi:cell wall integrity and stress response component
MRLSTLAFGAVLAATGVYAQAKSAPSGIPQIDKYTGQGCYTSKGNLTALEKQIPGTLMSSGSCNDACKAAKYWVSGLHGPQCLCGFALPPKGTNVSDSECNVGCSAYPIEACGGIKTYTVFNLGVEIDPPVYDPASSTSSSSASAPDATSTQGSTTDPTVSKTSVPTDGNQGKSGPNVAGIAAGVVVGVVAAGAAIGGFFFYMRRKRNAEIEEEHRRNAAVNAFISGSKPPSSHGSISMTDSRMDPVLAHRRMSDGSIADNEDYSRRILRV